MICYYIIYEFNFVFFFSLCVLRLEAAYMSRVKNPYYYYSSPTSEVSILPQDYIVDELEMTPDTEGISLQEDYKEYEVSKLSSIDTRLYTATQNKLNEAFEMERPYTVYLQTDAEFDTKLIKIETRPLSMVYSATKSTAKNKQSELFLKKIFDIYKKSSENVSKNLFMKYKQTTEDYYINTDELGKHTIQQFVQIPIKKHTHASRDYYKDTSGTDVKDVDDFEQKPDKKYIGAVDYYTNTNENDITIVEGFNEESEKNYIQTTQFYYSNTVGIDSNTVVIDTNKLASNKHKEDDKDFKISESDNNIKVQNSHNKIAQTTNNYCINATGVSLNNIYLQTAKNYYSNTNGEYITTLKDNEQNQVKNYSQNAEHHNFMTVAEDVYNIDDFGIKFDKIEQNIGDIYIDNRPTIIDMHQTDDTHKTLHTIDTTSLKSSSKSDALYAVDKYDTKTKLTGIDFDKILKYNKTLNQTQDVFNSQEINNSDDSEISWRPVLGERSTGFITLVTRTNIKEALFVTDEIRPTIPADLFQIKNKQAFSSQWSQANKCKTWKNYFPPKILLPTTALSTSKENFNETEEVTQNLLLNDTYTIFAKEAQFDSNLLADNFDMDFSEEPYSQDIFVDGRKNLIKNIPEGKKGKIIFSSLSKASARSDNKASNRTDRCYYCGLGNNDLNDFTCYNIFENIIEAYKMVRYRTKCTGDTFLGGCYKRFLDVHSTYNERGCRRLPPERGKSFASNRFMKLEYMLYGVSDGCVSSPMATLIPFSRSVSLYVRFHVCVCSSKYCNNSSHLCNTCLSYISFILVYLFKL